MNLKKEEKKSNTTLNSTHLESNGQASCWGWGGGRLLDLFCTQLIIIPDSDAETGAALVRGVTLLFDWAAGERGNETCQVVWDEGGCGGGEEEKTGITCQIGNSQSVYEAPTGLSSVSRCSCLPQTEPIKEKHKIACSSTRIYRVINCGHTCAPVLIHCWLLEAAMGRPDPMGDWELPSGRRVGDGITLFVVTVFSASDPPNRFTSSSIVISCGLGCPTSKIWPLLLFNSKLFGPLGGRMIPGLLLVTHLYENERHSPEQQSLLREHWN